MIQGITSGIASILHVIEYIIIVHNIIHHCNPYSIASLQNYVYFMIFNSYCNLSGIRCHQMSLNVMKAFFLHPLNAYVKSLI